MTKESPLPLMPDMVRAYYEDRKTQTRRVVKPQSRQTPITNGSAQGEYTAWPHDDSCLEWNDVIADPAYYAAAGYCPYGAPGDRLWIREALVRAGAHVAYAYDYAVVLRDGAPVVWPWKRNTLSSRYMPRWACRSRAELIAVRVEQVQDISEADAQAEGAERELRGPRTYPGRYAARTRETYRDAFGRLWDSINAKRGYDWANNPWVWVLTFRRLGCTSVLE